jgi:hypothetical protein
MGYIKRKTDKRVVVFDSGGGDCLTPSDNPNLGDLLHAIRSAERARTDRDRRQRKNKKKNQQRGT